MIAAAPLSAAERRRHDSALPGSLRDTLIGVLKVALPVAAVVLLAVIIIAPLTSAREFSFLLAKDKVAVSRERLRVDNALYRGQTAKGQPFEIRAAGAVQRSSAVPVVELDRLAADVQMAEGPARVTAPSGRYDMDKDTLNVAGPVRLASEAGYTLDSDDVLIKLIDRTVSTARPVRGTLPLGSFRAGQMNADILGRVVVLDGGAHLRIVPRRGT